MSRPKVSVLIPVYNGARFLRAAIDSVLNQQFSDFELIICDNASQDETPAIVKSYTDTRIRYHCNAQNIGLIPNWNMACSLARGMYIKLLPADDVVYPFALRDQVAVLDTDTSHAIALVASARHIINETGKVVLTRRFSRRLQTLSGNEAVNRVIRSGGNGIGEGGAVMFRASLLQKAGPFNSSIFYVLDLDQWFKFLQYGQLVYLPQVLSAFRVSSDSSSVRIAGQQRSDYIKFISAVFKNKVYGLTPFNFCVGMFKTIIFTELKKLMYRFVIR